MASIGFKTAQGASGRIGGACETAIPAFEPASQRVSGLLDEVLAISRDLSEFASEKLSPIRLDVAEPTSSDKQIRAPMPPYFESLNDKLMAVRENLWRARDFITRCEI